MKRILILLLLVLLPVLAIGQTKAGGIVYDDAGSPIPFANVVFAGSTEGTITNEDGRFYIQSDATYTGLKVSFVGFQSKEVALPQKVNYDLKITLGEETESLSEVVIYTGKQSKKNNPAIDILRKIWENKRSNGLSNVKSNFNSFYSRTL